MKNKLLALDSNIFIYHFESNPLYIPFTDRIFQKLLKDECSGLTSIISLIETLSYPNSEEIVQTIEESFKTLPNFTLCYVHLEIGLEASRIRRTYGFRLPDAIQLATCVYNKADSFITNDEKLQKFQETKVILLKDFT